ncbi:Ran GTPase binding protein Sbp1 [Dispira parvispora]|uniref:Ran GTPase binding protein Sbp1 n=1 Tax=Dispira parvispora TaxID=1520584 RepID=A0A9W8E6H5_9FUNG|nr:Ran GTPase binding protein Sbp1 [Dispira parvispora]
MADQEKQTKPTVEEQNATPKDTKEEVDASPDVHFEPVIRLAKVEVKTLEEDEDVVFKMRAKLYRFDKAGSEWKERGTGEMKLLQHHDSHLVRVLMRREKTFKICANHLITDDMTLSPNIGSDRSWVWNVAADISDGEPQQELLAIRFANSENAQLFKTKFDLARESNAKVRNGEPHQDLAEPKKEDDEQSDDKPKADQEKKAEENATKE